MWLVLMSYECRMAMHQPKGCCEQGVAGFNLRQLFVLTLRTHMAMMLRLSGIRRLR